MAITTAATTTLMTMMNHNLQFSNLPVMHVSSLVNINCGCLRLVWRGVGAGGIQIQFEYVLSCVGCVALGLIGSCNAVHEKCIF